MPQNYGGETSGGETSGEVKGEVKGETIGEVKGGMQGQAWVGLRAALLLPTWYRAVDGVVVQRERAQVFEVTDAVGDGPDELVDLRAERAGSRWRAASSKRARAVSEHEQQAVSEHEQQASTSSKRARAASSKRARAASEGWGAAVAVGEETAEAGEARGAARLSVEGLERFHSPDAVGQRALELVVLEMQLRETVEQSQLAG